MPRRGLPDNVCGERVYVALYEARPAGLHTRHLVAATGLRLAEVRRGLIYVREYLAAQHMTPLTWSYRLGYRLSDDAADWIAFERTHLMTELKRISRLITAAIEPHAARCPTDEWIMNISAQINAVQSSLRIATTLPVPRS